MLALFTVLIRIPRRAELTVQFYKLHIKLALYKIVQRWLDKTLELLNNIFFQIKSYRNR